MAFFHIAKEVELAQPNGWKICFQYGQFEYDSGSPPEHGYRFIWRKPGGQLQGARGQARLMPSWILILIGKATEAGWYPTPPERST